MSRIVRLAYTLPIVVALAVAGCSYRRAAVERNDLTRGIARACGLFPDFVAIDNLRAIAGKRSAFMSADLRSLRRRPGTRECLRRAAEDNGYKMVQEMEPT